ncbi:DUF523 domain-containing protein [Eggerthellaceae bacterium 3-80]|nr:DUF523 domain-containing protein [bacterium D16-34]
MISVAISACLLGEACRWDGASKLTPGVAEFARLPDVEVVAVCPEVAGGLSTPRDPSELVRRDGEVFVVTRNGDDVTRAFMHGALKCLEFVTEREIAFAVLKEGSPSCGSTRIYDGSFSGKTIDDEGICAHLFRRNGIAVTNEIKLQTLLTDYFAKTAGNPADKIECWDAKEFALWVQKNA